LIDNTKKSLRKYYIEARKSIPDKENLSEIVCSHIISLEIYKKSQIPVLYWAEKNEVSLLKICKERSQSGKKFGLPRCIDKNGEMEIFLANINEMSPDCHGILSPLPLRENSILPSEIDLIFVPATAFDIFGNRLGQGGGYYDRFLPKCKNAIKIGVCFSCQISENLLPVSDIDEKVDFVLSEKGIIKC
jgi:5-formyltetrahydrofolate cyclo-ligase